jgi:hypothetical protein
MRPLLALEVPVGHLANDVKRGSLDASFLTIGLLDQVGLPALSLAETQVHAYEHRSPILRFGASGSAADGQVAVARIEFASEIQLGFLFFPALLQGIELRLKFGKIGLRRYIRKLRELGQFSGNSRYRLPLLAKRLKLGEKRLRALLVTPNIGRRRFLL